MATSPRVLFSPLPDGESRLRFLGAGFMLECVGVVLLVGIPLLMPQKLEMIQQHWITPIAAPPVVPWKPQPPQPRPKPAMVKPEAPKITPKPEPVAIVPPKPKIMTPVFSSPIAKPATAKRDTANPDAPGLKDIFVEKKPTSLGSSAIPTIQKPREQVQTGGFGDPNGVPANSNTHGSPNIAVKGAFDLPPGPGYGNGTGGAKGAKGVVASAGFGNGTAAGSPNGGGHAGTVQTGSFGAANVAAPPAAKQTTVAARTEPIEIISKPRPTYTKEAKGKKVEGDVVVQVVFLASGQVQVQRVIRGLGYGLDEAAQEAARQIKFKPARQDGQPVDFAGNVHITFELAY